MARNETDRAPHGAHAERNPAPKAPHIFADLDEIAARGSESPRIPVFDNVLQSGHLIALNESQTFQETSSGGQQTIQILSGEGQLALRGQQISLISGDVVVIPPGNEAEYHATSEAFLGFSLVSSETDGSSNGHEVFSAKPGEILKANLFDLHRSGKREAFMSTEDTDGEGSESKVAEVEVFFPHMKQKGYDLEQSQAGRLLIYDEETALDRHTHPKAQHAIRVLEGHGFVVFEGERFDLTDNGLFVVPPNTIHQLGSEGHFLAFVVNTPGIPPSDPHYSYRV